MQPPLQIRLKTPDETRFITANSPDTLTTILDNVKSGQRLTYEFVHVNSSPTLFLKIRPEKFRETIARNVHAFFMKIGLGEKASKQKVVDDTALAIKNFPEMKDLLTLITERNNETVSFLKKPEHSFGIGRDSVRKWKENLEAKIRRTPPLMLPDKEMTKTILTQLGLLTKTVNGTSENAPDRVFNNSNGMGFAALLKGPEDTDAEILRYTLAFVDFVKDQADGIQPELKSPDVYEFARRFKNIPHAANGKNDVFTRHLRGCHSEVGKIADQLLAHERAQKEFKATQLMASLSETGLNE
jgi:hypothetical protein